MLLWNQDNDEHCYWFDKVINDCMAKDVGRCSSKIYRELARLVSFSEYEDVPSKKFQKTFENLVFQQILV